MRQIYINSQKWQFSKKSNHQTGSELQAWKASSEPLERTER
jgi:hypothetical protein